MGAPRMTRADSWKKRPVVLRYHAFRDFINEELKGLTKQEMDSIQKIEVQFWVRMPDSWSKKKKEAMFGKPHQQKPDIDNLQKLLKDAIDPQVIFDEDTIKIILN